MGDKIIIAVQTRRAIDHIVAALYDLGDSALAPHLSDKEITLILTDACGHLKIAMEAIILAIGS